MRIHTEIYTGSSFTVKVVRIPSYPGSWAQPTIATDVVYPMPSGNVVSQNDTQTIYKFNVTYALATFTVPAQDSGILSLSTEAIAKLTATVTEPLSNNRFRQTTCAATTTVLPAL